MSLFWSAACFIVFCQARGPKKPLSNSGQQWWSVGDKVEKDMKEGGGVLFLLPKILPILQLDKFLLLKHPPCCNRMQDLCDCAGDIQMEYFF